MEGLLACLCDVGYSEGLLSHQTRGLLLMWMATRRPIGTCQPFGHIVELIVPQNAELSCKACFILYNVLNGEGCNISHTIILVDVRRRTVHGT